MLGGEPFRLAWGGVSALIAAHWVVICYLIWLLLEPGRSGYKSPKAIRLEPEAGLLIVAEAQWLGQGVGVTVFDTGAGYERQVALGEVYNVQQDGLVQVRLFPFADDPDAETLKERLGTIGRTGLQGVIIKPGPLRYMV
jgi:hypothetical protein